MTVTARVATGSSAPPGEPSATRVVRLPPPLPLGDALLRKLEQLEQLAGRARTVSWGWCIGGMFVDVGSDESARRFEGDSLGAALGAAIRAMGGRP